MSEGIQRREGSGKGRVRGGIGILRDRVPRNEEKWGYAIRLNGGGWKIRRDEGWKWGKLRLILGEESFGR